jgi:hypothetical protein
MFVWQDGHSDVFSLTLKLVMIPLVGQRLRVKDKELAVLNYFSDRLCKTINNLFCALNPTLFKLFWIRLLSDTLLLQFVCNVIQHIVELGENYRDRLMVIRK